MIRQRRQHRAGGVFLFMDLTSGCVPSTTKPPWILPSDPSFGRPPEFQSPAVLPAASSVRLMEFARHKSFSPSWNAFGSTLALESFLPSDSVFRRLSVTKSLVL